MGEPLLLAKQPEIRRRFGSRLVDRHMPVQHVHCIATSASWNCLPPRLPGFVGGTVKTI